MMTFSLWNKTKFSVAAVVFCLSSVALAGPSGEALYVNCIPCHRADGSGNRSIGAPTIAGMPAWYVDGQLSKFRDGLRGAHPDDAAGSRMRPMALILRSKTDQESLVGFVASMSPTIPVVSLTGGRAEVGKNLYAPCIGCHGPDASGNQALKAPPLSGSDDWYLLRQLHNFKRRIRGSNPQDQTGMLMAPMAASLVDEQSVLDVVAYIVSLGE